MVGVLVATHGRLADEFLNSAAMLVGEGEQLESVCVLPGQSPDDFRAQVEEKLARLDTGEGVVALVDITGGTPNNTIYRIKMEKNLNVRIVTGVNLPMVMFSVLDRYDGMSMDELVDSLQENGTQQIKEFGNKQ